MLPLAVPGGIAVLVFLLVFSVPILLVVFVVLSIRDVLGGEDVDSERVEELEDRIPNGSRNSKTGWLCWNDRWRARSLAGGSRDRFEKVFPVAVSGTIASERW
ncbi:MAG: hypothetical protein ACOCP3_03260 [Halodesulfurarchaeum sp.]